MYDPIRQERYEYYKAKAKKDLEGRSESVRSGLKRTKEHETRKRVALEDSFWRTVYRICRVGDELSRESGFTRVGS